MPRLGLSQGLRGLVASEVLHLVLQCEKGLSLVGEPPQLRPDLVGDAGQLGMAVGSIFAAGRDKRRAVGCLGVD